MGYFSGNDDTSANGSSANGSGPSAPSSPGESSRMVTPPEGQATGWSAKSGDDMSVYKAGLDASDPTTPKELDDKNKYEGQMGDLVQQGKGSVEPRGGGVSSPVAKSPSSYRPLSTD